MPVRTATTTVATEKSVIEKLRVPKNAAGDPSYHQPQLGDGQLLTPPQVSNFLQVKLPRIYELVKGRRMRAVRVGRQLRFRMQDVEAFLERSTTDRW